MICKNQGLYVLMIKRKDFDFSSTHRRGDYRAEAWRAALTNRGVGLKLSVEKNIKNEKEAVS